MSLSSKTLTFLIISLLTLGMIGSAAASASGLSLSDSAVQPGENIFLSANSGNDNDLTFAIDKDQDGTFETHIATLDPSTTTLTSYDTSGVPDGEYAVGVIEEDNNDGQEDAMTFDTADSEENLVIDSQDPNTPAPSFSESGSSDGFDTDSTVEFNWESAGDNGQAGVENYKVKYSTNGGDTYSGPVSRTSTSYSVEADHGDNVKIKVAAVDSAGNEGSYGESGTIEVDTQKPEVTDVTVTPSPVTDSDTGSSVDVEVEFNEDMDQSTDPTVEVTELTSSYTVEGSWDGSKTWSGTFTVNDDNEEATGTVEVSEAEDEAGNTMDTDSSSTFEVDTNSPKLDSVTYQPGENTNKETLELAFSEGVSNVGSATDYTVSYDPDGDQRPVDVDDVISNGNTVELEIPDQSQETDAGKVFQVDAPSSVEDSVGNTLESNSATSSTVDQFDVTAPDVNSFSATHDDNWDTVKVTVKADEALKADSISADIIDSNDNSITSLDSFTSTDNTNEYEATYDLQDNLEDKYTVTLTGAEDTTGNSVDSPTSTSDTVEVDALKPRVSNVRIEDSTIGSTKLVKDEDKVEVTATVQDRNIDSASQITADLSSLMSSGGSSVEADSYDSSTATWTLDSVDTGLADSEVSVTVAATDSASNSADSSDSITADNTAPAVNSFSLLEISEGQDVKAKLETDEKLGTDSGDLEVTLTKPDDTTVDYTRGDFSNPSDGGTYTYTVTYDGGVDGDYSATLDFAKDTVGNDGASSKTASATVDAEDPTVSITNPSDDTAINSQASIQGDASDGNTIQAVDVWIQRTTDSNYWDESSDSWVSSETWNQVDAPGSDSVSWSYNPSFSDEGTYTVTARAKEGADGTKTTSSTISYDIDNSIDTASINGVKAVSGDSASDSVTVGTTQQVIVEVKADDKNFETATVRLVDGDSQVASKTIGSSSSAQEVTFDLSSGGKDVSAGTYSAELSVEDKAENEKTVTEDTVNVDGSVGIDSVSASGDGGAVDVQVVATEKLSDLSVEVNGPETATLDDFKENSVDAGYKYTATASGLPDGGYTATVVTAVDQFDNTADSEPSNDATVDEHGPTLTVEEGTDEGPVQTDTINVVASDAGTAVTTLEYGFSEDITCESDDSYGNSFESGTDFHIEGDRQSYLCVKASDESENTAYGKVGQLNTDNTPPEVSEIMTVSLEEDGDQSGVNGALVEFIEPVSDSSIKAGDWSIGGEQVDSVSNSGTDDSQVQLELTEPLDTTSSTEVTYTGNSLTDIAGNKLADVAEDSVTELDGSEPVLEQAEINQDLSGSSKTVLDLRFSETVSTSSASTAALAEQVGGELRFDAQTGQTVQATYYRDGQQAVLNTGSIYTDDDGGEARGPEIESFTGVTDVERFRDAGADIPEYEGPDSNECDVIVGDSSDAEKATISDGVSAAEPRETVCVEPGSYNIVSGTSDADIELDKDGLKLVSLTQNGNRATIVDEDHRMIDVTGNNVVIKGFKFEEVKNNDELIQEAIIAQADGFEFRHNVFADGIANRALAIASDTLLIGGSATIETAVVKNNDFGDQVSLSANFVDGESLTLSNNRLPSGGIVSGWSYAETSDNDFGQLETGVQGLSSQALRLNDLDGADVLSNKFENSEIGLDVSSSADASEIEVDSNRFTGTDVDIKNSHSVSLNAGSNYFGSDGIQVQGAVDASYAGLDAAESARNVAANSLGTDIKTFTRRLDPGYNLVSFPVAEGNVSGDSIAGGADDVNSIWSYEDGSWTEHTDQSEDVESGGLVGGKGYIFNMDDKSELVVNADHEYSSEPQNEPASIELTSGWNLVGSFQEYDQTSSEALNSVSGDYDVYNGDLECADTVNTGFAYWVTSNGDGTYTPAPDCS